MLHKKATEFHEIDLNVQEMNLKKYKIQILGGLYITNFLMSKTCPILQ